MLGKIKCEDKDNTDPLFLYLRTDPITGQLGPTLKWNFAKILCDVNGKPIKRYLPGQSPKSFENDLIALIQSESD